MVEPKTTTKPKLKWVVTAVITALVVGVAVNWALGQYYIQDWISSWAYEPTPEVAELEEALDLTAAGKRIWAATNPTLKSAEEFNEACDSHDEEISVLGCYVLEDGQIYIYNVTDVELVDANKTTAAHELLHAVWERLNEGEKEEIKGWLWELYESDKEWFDNELATYSEESWEEEMYTRVATKRRDLPEKLERHYAQYFKDRAKLVTYYENYIKPLEEKNQQMDALWAEIEKLDAEIEAEEDAYDGDLAVYNLRVDAFNLCVETAGCFSSEATYKSQYDALVADGDRLEARRLALNEKITEYNEKLDDYNEAVEILTRLYNRLNSNKASDEEAMSEI